MSETKGTKGPWGWQKFGTEWCLVGQHGMRPIVLDVGRVGKARGEMLRVRMTEPPGVMVPFDPVHPDAHLIAAAPALYSELAHLVRLLEPLEQDGRLQVPGLATLNGARRVLALARGESPSPDPKES